MDARLGPLSAPGTFEQAATRFAEDLSDTVAVVTAGRATPFEAVIGDGVALVRQERDAGIGLVRAGVELLRLVVRIKVTPDGAATHLRTDSSSYKVFAVVNGALPTNGPLYRYEFDRRKETGRYPAAHLQVHGRHRALEAAMAEAGRTTTRSSRQGLDEPNITDLHLPLGGTRFRPCLEDVLEHLIVEFDIDARADALPALRDARAAWRRKQLLACVRDDPLAAAEQLEEMGFSVTRPTGFVGSDRIPHRVEL